MKKYPYVHDRIISLRRKTCVHKSSLYPPFCVIVLVSRQEMSSQCICVLRLSILLLFTISIFEMFRPCDIVCFSFYHLSRLPLSWKRFRDTGNCQWTDIYIASWNRICNWHGQIYMALKVASSSLYLTCRMSRHFSTRRC